MIRSTIEFFNTFQKMFRIILGFLLDKPGFSCYIAHAVSDMILFRKQIS
jgi:hypothetical protein